MRDVGVSNSSERESKSFVSANSSSSANAAANALYCIWCAQQYVKILPSGRLFDFAHSIKHTWCAYLSHRILWHFTGGNPTIWHFWISQSQWFLLLASDGDEHDCSLDDAPWPDCWLDKAPWLGENVFTTEVAALARDEKSRPMRTDGVEGSLSAMTSRADRLSAHADQREELIGCNEVPDWQNNYGWRWGGGRTMSGQWMLIYFLLLMARKIINNVATKKTLIFLSRIQYVYGSKIHIFDQRWSYGRPWSHSSRDILCQ